MHLYVQGPRYSARNDFEQIGMKFSTGVHDETNDRLASTEAFICDVI